MIKDTESESPIGVIVDLSGVLFNNGSRTATKNLKEKGVDRKIISSCIRGPDAQALREGLISSEDFWKRKHSEYGDIVWLVRTEWLQGFSLNIALYKLLKHLRGQYHLICFSGTTKERVSYLDEKYNYRSIFDDEIYSYEIKSNKNADDMYAALNSVLKANRSRYVVVDDFETVIQQTITQGFHGIKYTTVTNLKKKLRLFGFRINFAYVKCLEGDNRFSLASEAQEGWIHLQDLWFRGDRLRPAREIATRIDGFPRSITPSIRELAQEFSSNPKLQPDPLLISQENGKSVVYEGRHRIVAAGLAGRKMLLAKIIPQNHIKVTTQKLPNCKNYYNRPMIPFSKFIEVHQDAH